MWADQWQTCEATTDWTWQDIRRLSLYKFSWCYWDCEVFRAPFFRLLHTECQPWLVYEENQDCWWTPWLYVRCKRLWHTIFVNAWFPDVHLSALSEHEIFSTIKPRPTQKKLVTALQCCPSQKLQVRHTPSSCTRQCNNKTCLLGEFRRVPYPEPYPYSHDRKQGWNRLGFIYNLYCKLYGSMAVHYLGLMMSRSPMSVGFLPVLEE